MFLHSGAGLHGHEYSGRHRGRRSQLRSSPRPLSEVNHRSLTSPAAPEYDSRRERLSLNESSLSPPYLTNPIGPAPDDTVAKELLNKSGPLEPESSRISVSAPPSEDEESLVASELSEGSDITPSRKKRRRSVRKTTRYLLAHPAPRLRTKQRTLVQIRPRLLLQLQQIRDRSHAPAFDVVPSSLVSGSIIIPKLAKRFPRMFRAKPYLGQNDLLLLRSEDYAHSSQDRTMSPSAGKDLDQRDVLAVISPAPSPGDDIAEIVLEDGSRWAATPIAASSYEFTHVDEQGNTTTARWVKRGSKRASHSGRAPDQGSATPVLEPSNARWTFSVLDPSTRRHPILGALTSESLEIFDTYNSMSASSGRFPPTRPFVASSASPSATPNHSRTTVVVTELQKTLMLASSAWISLRLSGWPASTNPKFSRTINHCRAASYNTSDRPRSLSSSIGFASPEVMQRSTFNSLPSMEQNDPTAVSKGRAPTRTMSSGAAYMRSRMASSTSQFANRAKDTDDQSVDKAPEQSPSCRIRIRQLTYRLFHWRSNRVQ